VLCVVGVGVVGGCVCVCGEYVLCVCCVCVCAVSSFK